MKSARRVPAVAPSAHLHAHLHGPTEQNVGSFKPEVIADNSGKWCGNAVRFPTEAEALEYIADLARRWLLVRDTRVVPSDDPANYRWIDGTYEPIPTGGGDACPKK